MRESGLTEVVPLACISAVWGQRPERLGAHGRWGRSLVGYQMARVALLPGCPQGSEIHIWGLELLMTVTFLFTEMAGILHFSEESP